MKLFMYAYNNGSKSVRELGKALIDSKAVPFGGIIRHEGSKFRGSAGKVVLNWGSCNRRVTELSDGQTTVLNDPRMVAIASNKTKFFRKVGDHARVPEFTVDHRVVADWDTVYMGRRNTGYGGKDIVFSDDPQPHRHVNESDLWVKYVKKAREFRVHVFDGKVIDVVEKKLRQLDLNGNPMDKEKVDWRVRNHENGFVFCRDGVKAPGDVLVQTLEADAQMPGLLFGAYDVIYNNKQDKAYVLECNTAPGIEGTTVASYHDALVKYIDKNHG